MSRTFTTPLKWVGGKGKQTDMICENMPEEVENYYEPFVGGGSVLLAILQSSMQIRGEIVATDNNEELINFYQQLQSNPEELWRQISKLKEEYQSIPLECDAPKRKRGEVVTVERAFQRGDCYYYYQRQRYNEGDLPPVEKAALFLFLNKTCFRGLYRTGANGFNVPYGNYKNPQIANRENILQISSIISPVKFRHCSFEHILKRELNPDDLIYLDPPYAPVKEDSFVDYNNGGFSLDRHKELFELCQTLPCKFLLSNADTLLVHSYFNNEIFPIIKFSARRAINSKKPQSRQGEVLIKNFEMKLFLL